MADYIDDISTSDYSYLKEISITETGGEDRTDFPVKLVLDSTNFNFELANSDGSDVRIGEGSNGTRILNIWIATWNVTSRIATVWLKIPFLEANKTKILYVYWGNLSASTVSDVDSIGFLLADGFDAVESAKWTFNGTIVISDSRLRLGTNAYIEAKNTPLSGITSWIVEEGLYTDTGGTNTYSSHRLRFYGTENEFGFDYYIEGDVDRKSNLVLGDSTYVTYNGVEKGLEGGSYSENTIAYYEPTDKVYQSMRNRDSYTDYTDSWERKVYGDTRITYFWLYGRNNDAAAYTYVDWVVVREFFLTDPYSFNTDNLFISWEQVNQETISWIEYDSDSTGEQYYHYSSYGGNPYRLSDNSTGSLTDCWFSDSSETVSEIDLVIDFGRLAANLVSEDYLHYDSGHVGYKNASKLSNDDEDVWGNDHFEATTTSGYVAIDFGYNATPIECVAVKAHTTASGMMKNFTIDGSYVHPILADPNEWENLYTGTFTNTLDWQTVYFTNGKPFRYYRIYFLDTYSNKPATLQEWAMHGHFSAREKKIISQLRIRPTTLSSNEVCFPKYITLVGSNGLGVWDTLIPKQKTYTPFYDYMWERWQRYSFTNTKGFYQYRLTCSGTWGTSATQMSISEWEMVERLDELHKYRIIGGSSSDFNNIWADNETTFDSGFIYITNNNLNVIKDDKLASSYSITGTIIDLNVV